MHNRTSVLHRFCMLHGVGRLRWKVDRYPYEVRVLCLSFLPYGSVRVFIRYEEGRQQAPQCLHYKSISLYLQLYSYTFRMKINWNNSKHMGWPPRLFGTVARYASVGQVALVVSRWGKVSAGGFGAVVRLCDVCEGVTRADNILVRLRKRGGGWGTGPTEWQDVPWTAPYFGIACDTLLALRVKNGKNIRGSSSNSPWCFLG